MSVWGSSILSSLPRHGVFTLGKKYKILGAELWTGHYAEFELADDKGDVRWVACGHFNEQPIDPSGCPCCAPPPEITKP